MSPIRDPEGSIKNAWLDCQHYRFLVKVSKSYLVCKGCERTFYTHECALQEALALYDKWRVISALKCGKSNVIIDDIATRAFEPAGIKPKWIPFSQICWNDLS